MITVVSAVLALATLAAIPGARGILGDNLAPTRLVIAAVLLHATLWACRRFALPGGTAWAIGAFVVVVGALGSWGAVGHETGLALDAIRTRPLDGSFVPESAEVLAGRMTLALLVVGLCVLLADQAAFRVKGSFLALAPSFALVLVGSIRSEGRDPAFDFWAYIVVCVAFLVIHHQFTAAPPAGGGARALTASAATALATPTSVLATVAVVGAFVLAPLVPGYGNAAVVETSRNRFGTGPAGPGDPGGDEVSVSPIVDIRPNLVERSATVAFTVAGSSAGYWRLTSLDRFNGEEWTASDDTDAFPDDVPFSTNATLIRQGFRIEALRSDWLPAAYRAQSVEGPAAIVDRDTHSVRAAAPMAGLEYQVTSLAITPTPERLASSQPVPGGSLAATRYLSLPRSLSSRVIAEARRVASSAGESGPYAMARALQDYFRTGYTYDLEVEPGNGNDALEDFVLRSKRGYCEQFAAAYAVMARSLGIPARVAVGFTAGDLRDDGRFHVQGLNAHAWPEVYLQGFGWIPFEPTPGRGIPGAEGFTGVPAAQAPPQRTENDPQTATTQPGSTATTPTTAGPEASVPTTVAGTTGPSTTAGGTSPATTRAGGGAEAGGDKARPILLLVAIGVVLATGSATRGYLSRRDRRGRGWLGRLGRGRLGRGPRRQHGDDRDRVLAAWSTAADSLAVSGLGRRPAETILDHANRAAGDERLPAEVGDRVLVLAGTAGTAAYGTADLAADEVEACEDAARTIKAAVREVTPLPRRLAAVILPRRA